MDENQSNKRIPKRVKSTTIPSISDIGRVPPQALDLEEAVIGAMLLDKNAVSDTIDILMENSFYDVRHQYIYAAIRELFSTSEPIDLWTVVNKLKKQGELELAGGVNYISSLTNKIASAAHAEFHARIISQKFIKREIIRMCNEVLKDSFDETIDVFDLLGKAEKDLFSISENNMKRNVSLMKDVVQEAVAEIEAATKNTDGVSGVPSGLREIDKITSGWQRSDMIVLAARPGMGKTALVLSMARNIAVDYNMGVAMFSLEMSSVQLVKRLISSETRISAEKLRKGNLRPDEMTQLRTMVTRLVKAPIYIDDTPGLSIFDLRAKCRRLKMQYDIQIVIIDYLQLMTAGGTKSMGNREQEISTISRSIKEIAKELNVPVIALSQLSRSVEQRGGEKKPVLSDLRESGAIEQDADIVSFIYRPEYYGINENENNESNEGIGEVIFAKHRNGAQGTARLRFIGEYARFENLEDAEYEGMSISGSAMTPNRGFENAELGTYTVRSKMNEDLDDFHETSDAPF